MTLDILGITMPTGNWANWFAGLASTAAVIVALGGHWLSSRRLRTEKAERDLNAALQIAWKLIGQINSTHDIYRHFWLEPNRSFTGISGEVERFRSTFPLVGVSIDANLDLSDDQANFLLRNKCSEILQTLNITFRRYQSLVRSVHEYNAMYKYYRESCPPPSEISDGVFSSKMSREQIFALMPTIHILEGLIESIREASADNVETLAKLQPSVDEAFKKIFEKTIFVFSENAEVGSLTDLRKEIPR